MRHIAFILHGKLKRKDRLQKQITAAMPADCDAFFFDTEQPGHALKLTKKALSDGAKYAIAVGGDGLLNEVVNGYMHCTEAIRKNSALGLIPKGTGNDFAKTIGAKADFKQLNTLLKNESVKAIDICLMRHLNTEKQRTESYYINIADIGIGGYVSQNINQSSKILGPDLSYMKAIISTLLTYRHRKIRLTAGDFSWEGKALLVVMANGKFFGSGLCIAPQAKPDDGKLQMVILGNVSLLDYLKHQGAVKRGEIIQHPEVTYLESCSCHIETIDECTIDMDGEFAGFGPVDVHVVPRAVRFLCE